MFWSPGHDASNRRLSGGAAKLLGSFLAAILTCCLLPWVAAAQHADDVWIMPAYWTPNGADLPPGTLCRFYKNHDFRETLLSQLQAVHEWPTAAHRITGFGTLLNMYIGECDDGSQSPENPYRFFTDAELADLATLLDTGYGGDEPLDTSIVVVGTTVYPAQPEHPSTPAQVTAFRRDLLTSEFCDSTTAIGWFGERDAERDFVRFKRWLENGGRIDFIQIDFTFFRLLKRAWDAEYYGGDCGLGNPLPTEIWTVERIAQELRAYFEAMHQRVNDPTNGLTAAQRASYSPDVHLWPTLAHRLWPDDPDALPAVEDTSLAEVLGCLRFFLEGGDATDPCYQGSTVQPVSGGPIFDAMLIDAGPNYVENAGTPTDWNFERLILAQDVARDLGLKVGITNHLGPCAKGFTGPGQTMVAGCTMESANPPVGPAEGFEAWAATTFARYAEEYVAAGGRPDYLMLFSWHEHPQTFGSETADPAVSHAAIARHVLTHTYPRFDPLPYLADDFSDASNWRDPESCFSVIAGTPNVIEDSSSTNGGVDGVCLATLNTDPTADVEQMVDFDLSFQVRHTSPAGFSGIAFRQTSPNHAPWSSGYMVYVRNDDVVTLYRGGPTVYHGTLQGDPQTGDGVELKLVVRGDRIRVFEAQHATPVLDVIDDAYPGPGSLSLVTINASARFSGGLAVTRLDRQVFGDFFEGYASHTLTSPWTDVVGWTVDSTDPQAQRLESSPSVNSFAVVDGLTVDDVRMTGRIEPGVENTSGSLQVRKTHNSAGPWSAGSGYSALINRYASEAPNGRLVLYCPDCSGAGAGGVLATATLGPMPTGGYEVDLVAIGDRVQVYVDGALEIDEVGTGSNRPISGTAAVMALGTGNTTYMDDIFLFEPLD